MSHPSNGCLIANTYNTLRNLESLAYAAFWDRFEHLEEQRNNILETIDDIESVLDSIVDTLPVAGCSANLKIDWEQSSNDWLTIGLDFPCRTIAGFLAGYIGVEVSIDCSGNLEIDKIDQEEIDNYNRQEKDQDETICVEAIEEYLLDILNNWAEQPASNRILDRLFEISMPW